MEHFTARRTPRRGINCVHHQTEYVQRARSFFCVRVCVCEGLGAKHTSRWAGPHTYTHTHNHTVKRTTWTHRSTINYYDCNSARDAWLRAQRLCEYRVPIKRVHNNSTKVSAPAQPYRAARWHSARAKCCSAAAADTARWVLLDSVRDVLHIIPLLDNYTLFTRAAGCVRVSK